MSAKIQECVPKDFVATSAAEKLPWLYSPFGSIAARLGRCCVWAQWGVLIDCPALKVSAIFFEPERFFPDFGPQLTNFP